MHGISMLKSQRNLTVESTAGLCEQMAVTPSSTQVEILLRLTQRGRRVSLLTQNDNAANDFLSHSFSSLLSFGFLTLFYI